MAVSKTQTSFYFSRPVQIQLPFQIPVVQVACGNFHSLALTKGECMVKVFQNQ